MTVPSTTRKAGPYNGNGVATSFAFSFKVFTSADIAVTMAGVDGTETLLVLDSGYSVTLNGDQDASPGGSITYPLSGTPLATGEALVVVGDLDYGQDYDVPTGGNFNPTAMEDALDKQAMRTQQLLEINSRSMTLAVTSADDVSTSLPVPVASRFIGWNAAANALINYAGVAGVAVSSFMAAVVAAADAAAARLLLLAAKSGANTDITSLSAPALGAATATTQAVTDSSTKVATTANVKSQGKRFNGFLGLTTSATLTAANAGVGLYSNSASVLTHTLPTLAATQSGDAFTLYNIGSVDCVLQRAGSDPIYAHGLSAAASLLLLPGDSVTVVNQAGTNWVQQEGNYFKGKLAQIVSATLATVATGTTITPFDDTIPQITEGDQYLTLTMTPKNAASTLVVRLSGGVSHSVGGSRITVALHNDAVASAIAASVRYAFTATAVVDATLMQVIAPPNGAAATTFRVRIGGSVAGTTSVNGESGTRFLGGSAPLQLTIEEYLP